jgi:hypothetical protein
MGHDPAMADIPLLIGALADRYRELLPAREFNVEVQAGRVRVRVIAPARHAGSVLTGPGVLALKLPLPSSLRLRIFFEGEARALQEFVSPIRAAIGQHSARHLTPASPPARWTFGTAPTMKLPLCSGGDHLTDQS